MIKKLNSIYLFLAVLMLGALSVSAQNNQASINLPSKELSDGSSIRLDGFFYETSAGRIAFPAQLMTKAKKNGQLEAESKMADGRTLKISIMPEGKNFN